MDCPGHTEEVCLTQCASDTALYAGFGCSAVFEVLQACGATLDASGFDCDAGLVVYGDGCITEGLALGNCIAG